MSDFPLNLMPQLMAKYDYVHDLLKWTDSSFAAIREHHQKSTAGHPLMESLLLSSLEKASQDIGSVPLLQFVIRLRQINERLEKTNANLSDTAARIDTFFDLQDEIPKLDEELKKTLKSYAFKSIVLFVFLILFLLVPSLVALVRCR